MPHNSAISRKISIILTHIDGIFSTYFYIKPHKPEKVKKSGEFFLTISAYSDNKRTTWKTGRNLTPIHLES